MRRDKKKILNRAVIISGIMFLAIGCSGQKGTPATGETKPVEVAAETEALTASAPEAESDKLIRTTLYGQVEGYQEEAVLIWKGIPYGAPPVGELRFKAPQDPESWEGIFDATKAGNLGLQLSDGEIIGSEDCLNLDIYRPDSDATGLPVLVFIHGGNNQTGQSGEISGKTIVSDGECIYISLNYRLGILGFNSLAALNTGNPLEDSGNYTLLDIAKALDWIQDNIEYFGGDKENVTVSGFSAGGRDVMAMLISPVFNGKFHKAISFSGGMTLADMDDSRKVNARALAPLAVADGLKDSEAEAYEWLLSTEDSVRDYLYELEGERLAALMGNASIRMSVFPHLFMDGTVLPLEGFETKNYNQVPLIMLTGSGEFSFFAFGSPYFRSDEYLAKSAEEQATEQAFALKYGGMLYGLFNAQESAERMAENYEAPIYLCEFRVGQDGQIWGDMEEIGAFHGIFVPFLDEDNQSYKPMFPEQFSSPGAAEIGRDFRAYISSFLWTGKPDADNLAVWETWNQSGKTMVFDGAMESSNIHMDKADMSYDDIIALMESDDSISEEGKTNLIQQVLNGRWFSGQLDDYFGNKSLWTE